MNHYQDTLALLLALAGVLSFAARGLETFKNWLDDDRIEKALDRIDRLEKVALRLEAINESTWAEEERKNGRIGVVRRLVEYEFDRTHRRRFKLAVAAIIGYVIALILLLGDLRVPGLS